MTRFGRYEVLLELGRGGMAELHLARLSGIGGFTKLVALKRILPHLNQNEQFVRMFLNEGRIAAQISHPNVCQVFEIGEHAGQLFMILEYLEGVTWEELAQDLKVDAREKLRIVTGVFAQACDGLRHAHELVDVAGNPLPVIHRDVSPQNLFITVDGVCKLVDFGIAKFADQTSAHRSTIAKGKPPYMSPEQVRAERLDPRSDIFSTGVVLWEALANRHLFVRESEFLMWQAVIEGPLEPVSACEPAYGSDVDGVVMRALERDRDRRYATIRELGDQLRALGDAYGGAASPQEIGELVRARHGEKLFARQLAIQALRRAPTDAEAWRLEATVTNHAAHGPVALRAESVSLDKHKHRRRAPWIALSAAALAAAVAVIAWPTHDEAPRPELAPTPVATVPLPDAAVPLVTLDASPVAVAPPSRPRKPHHEAVVAKPPGSLSLDVRPSAKVLIDGVYVDTTPVFRRELAAGKHVLTHVAPDGKRRKQTITITPGDHLNLGTIVW